MFNLVSGAIFIVAGLVWLMRARSGEKAAALVSLSHPEDLLMSKRERGAALLLGFAFLFVGVLYLWAALHRGV